MINTVSILLSLLGVGYVVIRAAMLDKLLPWFRPPPDVIPGFVRKRPQQRSRR